MDTERVNLSALDPSADRVRWERLIRGIMARAAPELARRVVVAGPIEYLGSWARPMLAAAAMLAAIAVATLLRTSGPVELPSSASRGVVDALQVPEPAAIWLAEDRSPTISDLILALERENR